MKAVQLWEVEEKLWRKEEANNVLLTKLAEMQENKIERENYIVHLEGLVEFFMRREHDNDDRIEI